MRTRNPLYVPADSDRKLAKALASSADAIIVDLEDSVAPSRKAEARAAMARVVAEQPRSRLIVRINGQRTPWFMADVTAVVRARAGAILLPKCEGPEDLMRVDHQLDALEFALDAPERTNILVLATETARSLRHLGYAGISARLAGLVFGAEDLAAELGIAARDATGQLAAPIAAARAALLIAAAEAQVPAIDTPWPAVQDTNGLKEESARGSADGFAGKQCIHPDQLAVVAEAFTPSPERLRWARAVRNAFATQSGSGVLTVDGSMVDGAHLRLAERILLAAGEP